MSAAETRLGRRGGRGVPPRRPGPRRSPQVHAHRPAFYSGLSGKLILEWVNHADLMRINGVGSEYADLLEAAGVDSVAELAQRNAANLAVKLEEINEAKGLVRRTPTEAMVQGWVAEAETLPKAVHH